MDVTVALNVAVEVWLLPGPVPVKVTEGGAKLMVIGGVVGRVVPCVRVTVPENPF